MSGYGLTYESTMCYPKFTASKKCNIFAYSWIFFKLLNVLAFSLEFVSLCKDFLIKIETRDTSSLKQMQNHLFY